MGTQDVRCGAAKPGVAENIPRRRSHSPPFACRDDYGQEIDMRLTNTEKAVEHNALGRMFA